MQPCVRVLAVAIGLTLALTISETRVSAAPEHSPASSAADANVEVKLPPLAPGQEMVVLVRRPEQAPEVAVLILPPAQAEQALGRPVATAAEPVAEHVASSASAPEAGEAAPTSLVLDVQPSRLPTTGSLDDGTPEPALTALAGMLLAGLGFSIRRARRGAMMAGFASVTTNQPSPWPLQLAGVGVSHPAPALAAGGPAGVCDWQAGHGGISGRSSRAADGTGSTEAAGRREASTHPNRPQAALHGSRYDPASVLEATRRLAARGGPRELAAELLDAAVQMLGGTGGLVSRFDQAHGRLLPAYQQPDTGKPLPLAAKKGASSQAVQRRAPVILDDSQPRRRAGSRSSGAHISSSIAVPLLYEGRVLGALEVQTSDPGRRFSDEDANGLELLAGVATAMLVGLQRAWLEGIRLTLRTVQHHVNNDLTITSGYAEFLALDASLPAELRQAARKVQQGARAAASILNELEPSNRLQADVWSRPTVTAIRVGPWAAGQPARVHAPESPGGVRSVRRTSTM
jgi:hypothetical protein